MGREIPDGYFPVPSETKFIVTLRDGTYTLSEVNMHGTVEIASADTARGCLEQAAGKMLQDESNRSDREPGEVPEDIQAAVEAFSAQMEADDE